MEKINQNQTAVVVDRLHIVEFWDYSKHKKRIGRWPIWRDTSYVDRKKHRYNYSEK
jgi:hypothetical protein